MLKDGIPLEGAIKQLCTDMRSGQLREQLELLERDLAKGTPLKEAIAGRNFPDYYKKMVEVGARTNDLPGTLTLLADYYERANALWTRLKGLLVYPAIVTLVSVALTTFLCLVFNHFLTSVNDFMPIPPIFMAAMWMPPVLMAAALAIGLTAVFVPSWRARMRWKLPAFREASLSQLASAIASMLRNGPRCPRHWRWQRCWRKERWLATQ
jgi:type II secretory pathway component PulF